MLKRCAGHQTLHLIRIHGHLILDALPLFEGLSLTAARWNQDQPLGAD